ncbi:hypothetical protein HanIR_Chr15g0733091 [Helianthus annuus]|nr:hypothetical protein HanIR_Chr15g0733091 [Helianthus annuus]
MILNLVRKIWGLFTFMAGVLKKSKPVFMERFGPLLGKNGWILNLFQSPVAKAANILFKKYYVDEKHSEY